MQYTTVHLVYFSPTHTSARVAYAMAEVFAPAAIVETDLTYEPAEKDFLIENELTILAVPVYGGRVAETAMKRLSHIKAAAAPVVAVVVYGNRDYEDALRELCDFAIQAGFTLLAGGAFVGEHSYSRPDIGMPLAAGRPDMRDLDQAMRFARLSRRKLEAAETLDALPPLQVKGNFPYKVKGPATPATPATIEYLCTQCGHCIEICPTQAVFVNDREEIASNKIQCIKCCACVKECPQSARVFETPYTAMLFANCKARREPELFV